MSKKEISLMGRKRTRELGSEGEIVSGEKKEALMAMKAEITPEASSASTVRRPEIQTEIQFDTRPPSPGVAVVYEKEVKAAVSGLIKIHYRLSEAGTLNRRAFSIEQQIKQLIGEIRKLLAEKADFYASKGMEDEDNRQACQQYVNDIREGLKQAGIKINYLEVKPYAAF